MPVVVVAEKPAVARDLAHALGATTRGEGCFRGDGHVVTWAVGHLVRLGQPHEIDPAWKRWRLEDLPIVPTHWPLVVCEQTRPQFEIVRTWLNAPDVESIVCATDAGREGELIFRYIYEAAGCNKPVRRLWLSSLTPRAIADAFRNVRDGRSFEPLAQAARGRSRADWLVGMNLSRLYSIVHNREFSVGRVQTPTLAMVVQRELEIRAFVPEDYLEVVATFRGETGPSYDGVLVVPASSDARKGDAPERARFAADGKEAAHAVDRAKRGAAHVESVERAMRRIPPPLLYDLTELQRHANRLFGFSAQKTLDVAQALYERAKLISYPRTDSRHLSVSVAEALAEIVETIAAPYRDAMAPGTGARPLGRRFVDDGGVTDHHAIIPTTTSPPASLRPDDRRIYDLVCRRLLAAWHDDHAYATTTVLNAILSNDDGAKDLFMSSGTTIEQEGWKVLDLGKEAAPPGLPPGLTKGQPQTVTDPRAVKKQTLPLPRFTEATLLTAMETAGRTLADKEAALAMRACGLGTPATRAAILEMLFRREYLVREGKSLRATDKAIALIEAVHPAAKSPLLTGEWEARLAQIQRGAGELSGFMTGIESFVRDVVKSAPAKPVVSAPARDPATAPEPTRTITPAAKLGALLQSRFGFPTFRPFQEEACRIATEGRDVLLVMPTGAGKSLCYQLPGLARGGTTLVVSPLIALMEDQVAKLRAHGIAAERIHSGRDRAASREASRAYLEGQLDFLFIAPERLKVPGFPELLARRKPALVAVDEAHCISQWGHDFRPDYRMLGEHLPRLRPAPILALTATATPAVQRDIVEQLALKDSARLIHGFRRTNLAIEIVETSRGERTRVVQSLLASPERRPAILYAPTRKEAESLAQALSPAFRAAAYHAGLPSARRDEVQRAFLGGSLEVVVATIAFGMGVDKADVRTVVHTALPATLEGYYQEIGRAGRDGAPSRAILLYSFADRKQHEFFHERDYPDPALLERMFTELSDSPVPKEALGRRVRIDADVFDKALEKLWLHGGARIDPDETVRRGIAEWRRTYDAQRNYRKEQLDKMHRYATSSACRMLGMVRHFGDDRDTGTPCGTCDACVPNACIAQSFREPSPQERAAAVRVLERLSLRDGVSSGQLHRDLFADGAVDRRSFEHVLGGLARAGIVRLEDDAFDKDGASIAFQRVYLTRESRTVPSSLPMVQSPEPSARRERRGREKRQPVRDYGATAPSELVEQLRAWRLTEARKRGIPAFRILTDRTMYEIATARPHDEQTLLSVAGVGPALVSKYGAAVLRIVSTQAPSAAPR